MSSLDSGVVQAWLMAHVRDALAVATVSVPIYAALETAWLGLSPAASVRARAITLLLIFLGLGRLTAVLRDLSQRLTRIRPSDAPAWRVVVHDAGFMAAMNAALAPGVYLASGANRSQLAAGLVMTGLVSLVTGPLNGIAIDAYRELSGAAPVRRLPAATAGWPSERRGLVIAVAVAASLLLTFAIYAGATPVAPIFK